MGALEDAKAALDDLRHGIPRRGEYPEYDREHDDIDKIDALIAEHERLTERLEEAYRIGADGWREAIEKAEEVKRLTAPPTDDERDALAQDIRIVDGSHNLGAGALAEALIERGWGRRPGPITDAQAARRVVQAVLDDPITRGVDSDVKAAQIVMALEAARSAES